MKVDYIVVGLGLAGLAFTKELEKNHKTFIVYNDNSQNSSLVAGGMYNPVILKRFSPVWNAQSQLNIALPMYKELEKQFNRQYDYPIDIYRIFKSVEEQNNWFIACDKPMLSDFMIPKIVSKKYKGIDSEFGFGKLTNTGRIDTKGLLEDYKNQLLERNILKQEAFKYDELTINETELIYQNIKASKIIFAEGFGLKKNPFFNYLPLTGVKGELLTIYAPGLTIDFLVKAAVFVLPLGNNYYRVGATFNWDDKTNTPTDDGKKELIEKLNSFITVPYEVVEHLAGIRPTVKDRRPLVGVHPEYKKIAVLNGLGTRGVMIGPTVAKALYNHLENKEELDNEISIARFQ